MGYPRPFFARSVAVSVTAIVALALLAPSHLPAARADTAPPVGTPATVSTDLLPTPQINGVVWSQAIVGDTVFVGGSFTNARPAGSAAGANTVPRSNLLSYSLSTGVLNPFAPSLNGQVRAVGASPDGTRLYVGGEFSTVNGSTRSRIAAFDTASGALNTAFRPQANSRVSAVVASNSTVYFGGHFTSVSNFTRPYVAAARASDGGVLSFAPRLAGGTVWALALSPDAGKLVLGGSFTTLNGSNNPGYGLGAVNTATGANTQWSIAGLIRNGGVNAAITGLSSDQDSVYGTGYVFGSGGNFEGTFRANWSDGAVRWVEDCHGDTYSAVPAGGVVYSVGHPHFCGNVGSFPETNPRTFQRGLAWTKEARTTVARNTVGNYYNFGGNPAPGYLTWWPDINIGSFTGQNQGAWNVTANANYVVLGGEFTAINNKPQQGLIRYAIRSLAPNKDGPRLSGANYAVAVSSTTAGTARITWTANYDRDNRTLKYELIRNGNTAAPIYTVSADSNVWFQRPQLGFSDIGLASGQNYSYRLRVTDPIGNLIYGADTTVTVR
ncbi:MAG: delta-60 repeat domain-containing protein [Microbacteriaceae bacterium]|nr:delta-60 repeat domain-containing protein [Microbacteriaceae bacterium]